MCHRKSNNNRILTKEPIKWTQIKVYWKYDFSEHRMQMPYARNILFEWDFFVAFFCVRFRCVDIRTACIYFGNLHTIDIDVRQFIWNGLSVICDNMFLSRQRSKSKTRSQNSRTELNFCVLGKCTVFHFSISQNWFHCARRNGCIFTPYSKKWLASSHVMNWPYCCAHLIYIYREQFGRLTDASKEYIFCVKNVFQMFGCRSTWHLTILFGCDVNYISFSIFIQNTIACAWLSGEGCLRTTNRQYGSRN